MAAAAPTAVPLLRSNGGMDACKHEPADPGYLPMKSDHLSFLSSDIWAEMLRSDLLPWLTEGNDLGNDVLELGPGPGLTTELLLERCANVTAVELDSRLAAALAARLTNSHVNVVAGDATDTGMRANRFTSVVCFHVLHHVPSPDLQDRLFAEAHRVLRPGGSFLVADALDQEATRQRHETEGETFIPIDPATLPERLLRSGFGSTDIELGDYQLLFRAHKRAASRE